MPVGPDQAAAILAAIPAVELRGAARSQFQARQASRALNSQALLQRLLASLAEDNTTGGTT